MDTQSVKRKAAAKELVPEPGPWRTRHEFCLLGELRILSSCRGPDEWAWSVLDMASHLWPVIRCGVAQTQEEARRAGIAAAKKLFRNQIIKPSIATKGETP